MKRCPSDGTPQTLKRSGEEFVSTGTSRRDGRFELERQDQRSPVPFLEDGGAGLDDAGCRRLLRGGGRDGLVPLASAPGRDVGTCDETR